MKLGSLGGLKILAIFHPSPGREPKIDVHVSEELPEETQMLVRAEIQRAIRSARGKKEKLD